MSDNKQSKISEIFKRLEQELRLHQVLARKSQSDIRKKSKLKRSPFDDNVLFKNTVLLMECSTLEDKLQKLKDEFGEGKKFFLTTASDLHPYACIPEKCPHCLRVVSEKHNPKTCPLCNFEDWKEGEKCKRK